jgi:hypothetical protein
MNTHNLARTALVLAALVLGAAAAGLPRSPAPKDVELYFISPKDGDTVMSPVNVRFGLRGMGVAPAGVAMENTGHHHLLIDAPPPPLDQPVPADAKHVHFGKGQTEASVTLSPGKHTLQLLLADHLHIPHDPPVMSKPITITVQ